MLKVVELFSGIGSQIKALKRIPNLEFKVEAVVEWDIHAIIGYYLIHKKEFENDITDVTRNEMIEFLNGFTFSNDGKVPLKEGRIKHFNDDLLKSLYLAVTRTNNLVNVVDLKSSQLPKDIDVMTYSFPCQDLSKSGFWHGNAGGIDRNTKNRSNMLWQVERLLQELEGSNNKLPRFLVMENVTDIISKKHIENFNEWLRELNRLNYVNQIYTLDSNNFNNPQKRKRTYMISVYSKDEQEKSKILDYFNKNDLHNYKDNENIEISNYLKLDYDNPSYFSEALISQPKNTPSRNKIFESNLLIARNNEILTKTIPTITTKQDRHPNSGNIQVNFDNSKANYRNLTPRECFLFMGFDESDYEKLSDSNLKINKKYHFFSKDKLVKLAGNSIVVNVLEQIFLQIKELDEILKKA